MNPWERVVKNCDLSKAMSSGASEHHDLSSMKSVMLNRKADFNLKKDGKGGDGAAGS